MGYKVVLLTGAPASGKSTLARILSDHVFPSLCFDFGRLILQRSELHVEYEQLRSRSNEFARPPLVASVDDYLVAEVTTKRLNVNIFIDSHAVTREQFGFRVTPSSLDVLQQLQLDCVVVLDCPAEERVRRISESPEGRLCVTVAEAQHHQALQEAVALTYGVITPCPVFVVEASEEPVALARRIAAQVFTPLGMTYSWKD
jgi:adenylate kinase